MVPKQAPTVGLAHLHAPAVSVREQAVIIGDRLRRERVASFRSLVADADSTLVVVARFLALLELFRESAIGFEQAEALAELTVRWTGSGGGRHRGRRRVRRAGHRPRWPTPKRHRPHPRGEHR